MTKSKTNKGIQSVMLDVRRCLPLDRDAVWQLHNESLSATGAHGGNGPWDDDLHRIEEVYLATGGEFLVGLYQGRIVAMGALKPSSSGRAEVTRMRVHPDFQRNGFGKRILEELERRAMYHGTQVLHLDTTEQQTAAQRFYTKNGYREIAREHRGRFRLILYEKSLTGGGT